MNKLEELILRHEGLRLYPYLDTVGKWTIGVGRNLSDRGISESEAHFLLENDIEIAINDVRLIFDGYIGFSENRKNALVDMMFCLGRTRFLGFKHMIQAITDGDWIAAADAMRNSLWHDQVPTRVNELANMIEEG